MSERERPTLEVHFPAGHLGFRRDESAFETVLRVIGVAFGSPENRPSKYGASVENDVFLMKPYCWCEREGECAWCTGCSCPEGSYGFFVDGAQVSYEDYDAFFKRETGKHSTKEHSAWTKRADAANARRDHRQLKRVCDYCTGGGIFAPFGPKLHDPDRHYYDPPNFWYRPANVRVTWYKYIGRDMAWNTDAAPPDMVERIFATHPTGMTWEDAVREYVRRSEESASSWKAMIERLNVPPHPSPERTV